MVQISSPTDSLNRCFYLFGCNNPECTNQGWVLYRSTAPFEDSEKLGTDTKSKSEAPQKAQSTISDNNEWGTASNTTNEWGAVSGANDWGATTGDNEWGTASSAGTNEWGATPTSTNEWGTASSAGTNEWGAAITGANEWDAQPTGDWGTTMTPTSTLEELIKQRDATITNTTTTTTKKTTKPKYSSICFSSFTHL